MTMDGRALVVRTRQAHTPAAARRGATCPEQLRAHTWIEARHFFSRSDAQQSCWLWLLGGDGRVHALRLEAARLGDDHAAKSLLTRFAADPDMPIPSAKRFGPAFPLPNAPVVPLPRWSVSWGHPLQIALRAFAAELDAEVLETLGWLEAPGPCFGTVANYNRLALLPPTVRRHRIQALREFPPLVAPLLLDTLGRPDMFATDEDEPARRAHPERAITAVLEATDRGRDLIGALASHYRISRALVRAPFCRERWEIGHIPLAVLRLLDAVPAHARPRERASVEDRLPRLHAMPIHNQQAEDVARLAPIFKGGWDAVWVALEAAFPHPTHALRDSRDFLRSALEQAELPAERAPADVQALALAWLLRLGPLSLLQASQRWHAQPLVKAPVTDHLPDAVAPLFGTFECEWGHAIELTTRQALIDEGEAMHHCIGGYWPLCVTRPLRAVHFVIAGTGETATATFECTGNTADARFRRDDLRAPCDDECGMAAKMLADRVLELINADAALPVRQQALRLAAEVRALRATRTAQRDKRPLDRHSRAELRKVLAWHARHRPSLPAATALLRAAIAGFHYHHGPDLRAQLAPGDALQLVREAANVYDAHAVRIDWQGHKLGYVPRAHSAQIAGQLDRDVALVAAIVGVDERGDAWNPIQFEITPA